MERTQLLRTVLCAFLCTIGATVSAVAEPVQGGAVPELLIARAELAVERAELAEEPGERDAQYDEAIAAFSALIDQGVENAAVHRNIGTVHLLKGDTGRAIASLRRAERLDPRDERVQESLEAARGMVRTEVASGVRTKAIDAVFFWRGLAPRSALLWVGGIGWVALWGGFAWRLVAGRRGLGIAAIGAVLLGLGFGSLLGERALHHTNPGAVIVQESVTGYRGPSEGVYEPSFEQPIRAGVEGSVLEQREGWARLRLRSGAETWVRASAIEMI